MIIYIITIIIGYVVGYVYQVYTFYENCLRTIFNL